MDSRLLESFAHTLGVELNEWQVGFFDGVCNAETTMVHAGHWRQEGGSTAAEIWALWNLMLGRSVLYVSQLKACNVERMFNMRSYIYSYPELFSGCQAFTANGRERIEHPQGNCIRFKSLHGRQGGRGMTADLVIVDCPVFKDEIRADVLPVMACKRTGQLVWVQSVDRNDYQGE